MASFHYSNFGESTLASGVSDSATALTVAGGEGQLFPNSGDYQLVLVRNSDGAREIVKCTSRSTDVLTVVREREGTTGLTLVTGDKVELRMTAEICDLLLPKVLVTFGTTGNILGTSVNVSSITDDGTGIATIVFDTDFANTNYIFQITGVQTLGYFSATDSSKAVGSIQVRCAIEATTLADPDSWSFVAWGTQ